LPELELSAPYLKDNQAGIRHGLLDMSEVQTGWHVLWTRSNQEKVVLEQLAAKRYEVFLPMISQWSKRKGRNRLSTAPMFKSYLFLRHCIDKHAYLDISKTKGLVNILGPRWDNLAKIPEKEIEMIRLVAESRMPAMPYPYLAAGSEVRITRGSLANAEGILVETDPANGLFVISVGLLQRSVAVKIDCADVERV
jgi:transcription antitermination factor NusG